jgi:hypothetical protein
MALISKPNTFSAGQSIIASQHNSNFDTIYSDYNGNIDNSNIAAGAGIEGSKLADVEGNKLITLNTIQASAGVIPSANIPSISSVTLDAVPDSHNASGVKVSLTASKVMGFGDVCYVNSSGTMSLVKADAIATASGMAMCVDTAVSAGSSGTFLLQGIVVDASWSFTVGGLIFASATGTSANTLTQSAPSGANNVTQILGVALAATKMYFAPSLSQVEHI